MYPTAVAATFFIGLQQPAIQQVSGAWNKVNIFPIGCLPVISSLNVLQLQNVGSVAVFVAISAQSDLTTSHTGSALANKLTWASSRQRTDAKMDELNLKLL